MPRTYFKYFLLRIPNMFIVLEEWHKCAQLAKPIHLLLLFWKRQTQVICISNMYAIRRRCSMVHVTPLGLNKEVLYKSMLVGFMPALLGSV